jgi:hypothetical protein
VTNQYHALVFEKKYPKRVHILRFEDIIRDPKKTIGDVCKKLSLEVTASLETPTWNGAPLEQVSPWGTIRQATPQANRETAHELTVAEKAEVRAYAGPYLDAFDFRSFPDP